MDGTGDIGILVIQGTAESSQVVDTVALLRDHDVADLAVLASSPDEAEVIRAELHPPVGSVESALPDGPSIPSMLRGLAAPFVVGVQVGHRVDFDSMSRSASAMERLPHLVLAVAEATKDGSDGSGSDPVATRTPREVDGRELALQALVEGGTVLRHPTAVTFRRNAIGTNLHLGVGQANDETGVDWCLRLSLSLLRSGGAWIDADHEFGVPHPGASEPEEAIERWPSILALAVQLGLIDDRSAASEAVVAYTRRVATLARQRLVGGDHVPEQVADAVQSVSSLFQEHDALRHAEEARLALHIVVNLSSGEHDGTTIGAAMSSATQVTVIGPLAREEADKHGVSAGPSITSASEVADAVAGLVATSELPVLLVDGGETPVVMDRHQIRDFLRDSGWATASLCTPHGWQTRLWRGGRADNPSGAADAPEGLSVATGASEGSTAVVQSLQLNSVGIEASADWWLQGEDLTAQRHELRRFVIAAPDYTDIHGGVVAMHRLCDRLNRIGYEAYIEPLGDATGITRPGWHTPLWWRPNFDGAVMVYPEIVTGNPLGAQRVVRWLLNRPAWFTGSEMEEDGDDLIVAFSPQIAPDRPVLTVPLFDPTIFFPKDVEGQGGLLWIGKGVVPPDFDRSNLTLITNDWPTSRFAMADLLRRAEVLYTCDWLTTIIGESLMCGTPVVLVGDQTWRREDIALWPGMTWEDRGGVDGARKEAMRFVDDYRSSVGWSDQIVENFVSTVNEHFARHPIDRWDPAELGPTLPSYSTRITTGIGGPT